MKSIKIFAVCVILFLLERVFFTRFQIFSLTPWLLFSFCAVSAAYMRSLAGGRFAPDCAVWRATLPEAARQALAWRYMRLARQG